MLDIKYLIFTGKNMYAVCTGTKILMKLNIILKKQAKMNRSVYKEY